MFYEFVNLLLLYPKEEGRQIDKLINRDVWENWLHNKGNDCIIEFSSVFQMNGKDGYKQMIEMNIFSQRYPCKTKDLLWYKETRQAILLMVKDKKTLDEIKMLSENENLYNAASSSRANEIRTAIARRISAVDLAFLQFFAEQSSESQKLLCAAMVMLTDRTFYEFMDLVYREKLIAGDFELHDSDVLGYLHFLQEREEHAAQWTDAGIKKVRDNYKAILREAGMISDSGTVRKILKPMVSQELQGFLTEEGLERIGKILTGERG